ncbi:hypothetical protein JCM10207_000444 [Rhodosporidiobolus poonsookiae]
MAFSNPSQRFRAALLSPTSSLSHIQRLADRLPSTSHGDPDLRNTDPQTRQTSLHLAASSKRTDVASWLLDEGVDAVEVSRDAAGDTVLHVAAGNGAVDILNLYLAEYSFVLEWHNARGMTPLHSAAMKGEVEAAQILIDNGADLDAADVDGNTPLHYASSYGKLSVVKLLIDLDCHSDVKNVEGFTAADYAFSFPLLKELDSLVRQHLEQLKEAKRAARQHRKAKAAAQSNQTIRSKRNASSTALSIALPPLPSPSSTPDAFTSSNPNSATSPESAGPSSRGYGLGLSYSSAGGASDDAGTTSPALPAQLGIPSLGSPIPPTPAPLSPETDSSTFPSPHFPPAQSTVPNTPSESPSTPRTPASPYPNTTSPQASPLSTALPSPGAPGRATTPSRSSLSLRRPNYAPSTTSPLSTPTSAGAPSSSLYNPSPASALSAKSTSTGVSSSGQTATPTPASPTPASSKPLTGRRQSSSFSSLGAPSLPTIAQSQQLEHPIPLSALAEQHLRERSLSNASSSSFSSSAAPPPLPSFAAGPQSPPGSPPRIPLNANGGHKLIRKSRSAAAHPSPAVSPPPPPAGFETGLGAPPAPAAAPALGTRSVSGPAGTSLSNPPSRRPSSESTSASGHGHGPAGRSTSSLSFFRTLSLRDGEGAVEQLDPGGGESEKNRKASGGKLRKEKHGPGGGVLRGRSGSEDKGSSGGRLARALGLKK